MRNEKLGENTGKPERPKVPNTKIVPSIITLVAALISCLVSIYQRVDFGIFVKRFLVVVVVFLFLSTIIKMVLDYSFRVIEEPKTIDDIAEEEARENGQDGEESTVDGEVTEESNND